MMSGIIRISMSGGKGNNPPTIRNFRQEGKIESTFFDVKYIAEDFENTILRHYVYIDGRKQDISKDVGYEAINNEFTYRVNNLNLNTKYQIQIEVTDGIDTVRSDTIFVTTANYQIFGVRVMENNSNPNNCCTYIEDAIGTSVATKTSLGGWADKFPFNKIRMVGFKGGKVTKEIKPSNKTQYIDGTTVSSDVDVMVEIPKVYWKFVTIPNGYEMRISNYKIDNYYDCYAHKVGGVEKDFIYVGAYLGYNEGGKLRSKSGVSPTVNTTLTQFRNYAHNVGSGYQQFNWFTLSLLQILYLIAYKNLNSQNALGMGVCSASKTNTGGTNTKGIIFGNDNKSQQVCFLGIEDFYGNIYQWIDGMKTDGSFNVLVTPDNRNFNDNGSGFKNVGKFLSNYSSGYTSKVVHTNEGGFFPKEFNGSATTNYSDWGHVSSGCFARFGGSWSVGVGVGAFFLYVDCSPSNSNSDLGSRLVFLG